MKSDQLQLRDASIMEKDAELQRLREQLEALKKNQRSNVDTKSARPSAMQPVVVGGELYPRFRQWLTAALAADSSVYPGDESPADALERKTAALLSRLQTFAVDYFANGSGSMQVLGCGHAGPLGINKSSLPTMASVPEKWRCSRCSFPNMATTTVCTACCLPRP